MSSFTFNNSILSTLNNTSFEHTSCDSFDEDYSMNADLFNITYK